MSNRRNRWYGLYLGDEVIYNMGIGKSLQGTVVELGMDNNKAWIETSDGLIESVVCEYCKKKVPENSIFNFRPVKGKEYVLIYHEFDEESSVYVFDGSELEDYVLRAIKNMGAEINKIEIYTKDALYSRQLSLYQLLEKKDFIHLTNKEG